MLSSTNNSREIEVVGDLHDRNHQYSPADIKNVSDHEVESLNGARVPLRKRIKYADVTNSIVLVILCVGLAIVIAIVSATYNKVDNQTVKYIYPTSVSTVYPALGDKF
jgi:hypothetical protein